MFNLSPPILTILVVLCLSPLVFFCLSRLLFKIVFYVGVIFNFFSFCYFTKDLFLCFTRSNVFLDGNTLSIPAGFPTGAVGLNGSLWIGGVDERTTIPRAFPVINAFQGGMNLLKLNGE